MPPRRPPGAPPPGRRPGPDRRKQAKPPDGKKKKRPRPAGGVAAFRLLAGGIAAVVAVLAGRTLVAGARAGKRARAALARAAANPLHFSEHARCRMECRHVSEADVRSALKAGTVVLAKSDLDAAPCAKLVVEEGARVTAVVSACPADTGVVTVWDRTHDWVCDCPT